LLLLYSYSKPLLMVVISWHIDKIWGTSVLILPFPTILVT
jgi:hypothetical protein